MISQNSKTFIREYDQEESIVPTEWMCRVKYSEIRFFSIIKKNIYWNQLDTYSRTCINYNLIIKDKIKIDENELKQCYLSLSAVLPPANSQKNHNSTKIIQTTKPLYK